MQTTASPSQLKQADNPHDSPAGVPAPFYTKQGLFQLFMTCAFPLHIWTLLMAFRDFGWVSLRTNAWDGIGLVAYALIIALFETLFVFITTLALGFLLPRRWETGKRLAVLGFLVLMISSLSIITKVFGLYGSPVAGWLVELLSGTGHPLRLLWSLAFLAVLIFVVAPLIGIMRSSSLDRALVSLFDRLAVLSSFYLFLDLIAIIVIVARNLSARASVI